MKIKFTDNSGEAFSNVEVTFITETLNEVYITDSEGNIEFFEAKKGDEVKCYIHKNEIKTIAFNEKEIPVLSLSAPLVDMVFVCIGKDEESVTGAHVFFEFGDKEIEKISDNTGQIVLEKVPLNTKVKVYQIFAGVEKNVEINKCRNDKAQYFIVTEKFYEISRMKFKLVDKTGVIIRNADLRIKVSDKEFETVTDHFGNITIDDVKIGETIECKQLIFGKSLPWHKFKCEKNIDEYILHGEKPSIYSSNSEKFESQVRMRFRLLNSKMQPIPNAILRLEYGVNARNKYTNQAGEGMIDDVMIGDKVNVMVSLQGKKTEAEFICQQDDELHEIIFKSKTPSAYYLIIPLVLFIGFIIFYANSGGNSTAADVKNVDTIEKEVPEIIKKDSLIVKNYQFYITNSKTGRSVAGAKVKLNYSDNIKEQIADNRGYAQFATLKGILPISYEISAFGYRTINKQFIHSKMFKIQLATDDSIQISNELLPCSTVVESKGAKITINSFKMNSSKGNFKIWYNLFDMPDKVEIFNGTFNLISDKSLIYSNKDYLTGIANPGMEFNSPDSIITVKISSKQGKINWLYKIYCARQTTIVNP